MISRNRHHDESPRRAAGNVEKISLNRHRDESPCREPGRAAAQYGVDFRGVSPVRSGGMVSPPVRRPPVADAGGWVIGRIGLPGGFRESRSVSPLIDMEREKELEMERQLARERERERQREKQKLKEEVANEGKDKGTPVLTRKQSVKLADTWRNSMPMSNTSSAGICALWDASGAEKLGPLYDLLKEEGLANEETAAGARQRADMLEAKLEESEAMIEMLRQGLLRCEKIARPHTINAEYKDEWDEDPETWGTLPDYDRTSEEVVTDATDTVRDACKRLRDRTDQALNELCENSQEILVLQKALKESAARIRELEDENSQLQAKVSELSLQLLELQKIQPSINALRDANAALTKELEMTRNQLAKANFDHDQLRIEVCRLIKRNRAANKRSKDDYLPTYREESKIEVGGPAWIPTGAPYRHTLDDEATLMKKHEPWPVSS
eukprot:TRINITY_DN14531_c0_g1_i1.p1 TRINITY_DN14531_c0_g1~~TRINITY_DN14531_c0_g1_i1.p1  ORF type:complete len:441 (+),score=109.25 TRINITY_DN14531_c0_g1_i1:1174-2496(+)